MRPKRARPLGPTKDPFLREILRALEEVQLDPTLFERAMGDLLRDALPGLVPVSGGGDQGFDGSIADRKGEPYPLVCTTAEDAESNLRKSLRSNLENGWSRRKAAFATSRRLTPGKRKKLRNIAREEGITLVQIFERDAIADRLARDARWCKELLGVAFRWSPLSAMPRSRRLLHEIPLVARAKDSEWLQKTPGDRVLVGEPGSGKTFLLDHLIRHGRWPALFLNGVESSDDEIARALQDLKPKIVILDDAHAELALLARLVHLRSGGLVPGFDLVATTWRGGAARVSHALGGVPADRSRQLEMLARDEIVQVMRSVGLDVDDELMRFLVDQASNRPGLAVTIALRALQGEWQSLISGDALAQDLLAFFESSSGPEVQQVLAGLALGGDRGMAWEDVAEFLGVDFARVQRIVTDLSVGGVLREIEPERGVLAVWPRVLRSALLRSIFFGGGTSRNFKKLLDKVPSLQKSVEAILKAIESGGTIGRDEIRALVMQAGSTRAWNQLAALSEEQALWVLKNYPEDVRDVAAGAISKAPDLTIRRILDAADAEMKAGERDRSDPFGPLRSWIEDLDQARRDPQELVHRRRSLAIAAKSFLESGGSPGIGLRAILLALSPKFRKSTLDPGAGRTVSFRQGLLSVAQVAQVAVLWDLSKDSVKEIDDQAWSHLASAAWDWADPESVMMDEVPEPLRRALHDLGERVLQDLAPLARSSPGLSAGFLELSTRLEVSLPLERDATFDVLFPARLEREERQPAIEAQRVRKLAEGWVGLGPLEVARRLAFYLSEGRRVGKFGSGNLGRICWELARGVELRLSWLEIFLAEGFEGAFVRPFLAMAVERREAGWEAALQTCLDTPRLAWVALGVALALPALPDELRAKTLTVAAEHPDEVLSMSLRREIPSSTLEIFLRHSSREVALAAAVGEWNAEPRGQVRPEITAEWRATMTRPSCSELAGLDGLHRAVLLGEPALAATWLAAQIDAAQADPQFVGNRELAVTVARSLDRPSKDEFLRSLLGGDVLSWQLVPTLVDGDPNLFRELLKNPCRILHLRALAREPDDAWVELVRIAIVEGFSEAEIVNASRAGSGIPYYEARDAQLARFENHPIPGVRAVVSKLREQNSSNLEGERKRDRDRELHGSGGLE